jgi:hypothetical protein
VSGKLSPQLITHKRGLFEEIETANGEIRLIFPSRFFILGCAVKIK